MHTFFSVLDESYGAASYFCIVNISPVHIVGVGHTIAKSARMRRSANSENNRGGKKETYTKQSLFSPFNLFIHAMEMLVPACHSMHTCFHFLTGAMGQLLTCASPRFSLYVYLESPIRLPSLLRCGGQPTQKTTAAKKKQNIRNSHYLVPFISSYMRWGCSWRHVIVLKCDDQLILKIGYKPNTAAACKLQLEDTSHRIPKIRPRSN